MSRVKKKRGASRGRLEINKYNMGCPVDKIIEEVSKRMWIGDAELGEGGIGKRENERLSVGNSKIHKDQ